MSYRVKTRNCFSVSTGHCSIRRVKKSSACIPPTRSKVLYICRLGKKSVAVGLCEALHPDDVVFGTYRGHALYLAKGGDLPRMMAELYGKVGGCARGKAGSMHLIDPSVHLMGTSAIVATTIPQAVGYALVLKMKKSKAIVVSVFGDGGDRRGRISESINFASLKKLPILFVCENNQSRSIRTFATACPIPICRASPILSRACDRDRGWRHTRGLPSSQACRVRDPVRPGSAIHRSPHLPLARSCGPGRRTASTNIVRMPISMAGSRATSSRSWLRRYPIRSERKSKAAVNREIAAAIEFAERSAFPPATSFICTCSMAEHNRTITYAQALYEATHQEMERDDSVFVFGLDVR